MSDNSKVLKEYLLSLGFRTDKVGEAKMGKTLLTLEKTVGRVGGALIGAAAGAAAMVNAFASSMEKAYYTSRIAGSTVSNMKAAAYAGKQIGLTADQVQDSIKSLAMSLRSNPGTQALLESLGVKVEGRDMSDVMADMVKELGKMPFWLGSQFGEKFGQNPEALLLLIDGLEKYNAAQKQRKEMAAAAGVDEDAAAKAAVEYKNALNGVIEKVTLLGEKVAVKLLPWFRQLLDIVNTSVDKWTQWSDKIEHWVDVIVGANDKLRKIMSWNPLMKWLFDKFAPTGKGDEDLANGPWTRRRSGVVGPAPGEATGGTGSAADFTTLSGLESKYGLSKGILDYVWWMESRRGKRMLSPKGAAGDMGFMPATAKDWNVDVTNRQSSFQGAARYLQYLLKHYDGDVTKALAAYNWGMGNVDADPGLTKAPSETRDYVRGFNGMQIGGPQTTIIIQGGDPQATANEVGRVLDQRDADYQRNLGNMVLQ